MKRMIVIVLLLALLLSGCSLAQRGEDGQDVLVGFLATRKPLDLFDFAGYLKEHPEALNGGEVSVDIIKVDYTQQKKLAAAVSRVASNINQICRRINSSGHLYTEDVAELKERQAEIWSLLKETQRKEL